MHCAPKENAANILNTMDENIQTELDYTPLTGEAMVKKNIRTVLHPDKHGLRRVSKMSVGMCALLICALIAYDSVPALVSDGMNIVIGVLIIVIASGLFFRIYGVSAGTRNAMRTFAARNNIQLLENVSDPDYSGVIFRQGYRGAIREAYVFSEPLAFEVGNYHYSPSASSTSDGQYYGYVKIPLPRKLPNIILNSTKNDIGVSSLPITYQNNQLLKLEGNFGTYYRVYAPQRYQRDALYILTPDIMQALIDLPKVLDVELVDDSLYLYCFGMFRLDSASEIQQILDIATVVSKEFTKQAQAYRDDSVHNSRVLNMVAPAAQQLKTSIPTEKLIGFIALICAGTMLLILLHPTLSLYTVIILALGVCGIVGIAYKIHNR